ncbi:VOC family protein [Leptospira sp. WS92.C1]
MIHHIAIGSPKLDVLVRFYETLPGLTRIRENRTEKKELRSVWFQVGEIILMLESDLEKKGPKALIFSAASLDKKSISTLPNWIQETEYTKYFKDPDDNLIGYSSYPALWPF